MAVSSQREEKSTVAIIDSIIELEANEKVEPRKAHSSLAEQLAPNKKKRRGTKDVKSRTVYETISYDPSLVNIAQ